MTKKMQVKGGRGGGGGGVSRRDRQVDGTGGEWRGKGVEDGDEK